MATSGTFTGSRASGASSTSPRLILDWSRVETDIPGNRSKIRLTLKLDISGRINITTNRTGSLHGSSFTVTGGIAGSSTTRTLQTRDVWVNHNSDGSKSQSFSASFNINISYSGVNISSLSVSGTAAITAIPRASGFTAFGLSNTTLKTSTAVDVTYTLDRKASSFSHLMTLKLGNKTIISWTDSNTGARTRALTTAQVNSIIAGRPNNTSGTLTLTMQTRSGSTNIGSSVSRTRTFSISTDVKPSASGITATISGDGRDKTINRFVQNITKVESKFTSSAGYGASVSSRSIVVRRVSGSANSQTISGSSGTTANAVSLSGTYEAIGTIKDSRGRTATSRTTFEVQSYSNPKITTFTAVRNKTTPTTVNISRAGTWSSLGTGTASLNNLTISIQRRLSTSTSWTSVQSTTGNTGSFTGSVNSTSNSEASSYEFRITITDTFGKKATSVVKVGTSFLELTISKGKGIGVGKVHEEGALDVKGGVFLEGAGDLVKMTYSTHGFLSWYKGSTREGYIGRAATGNDWLTIRNEINGQAGWVIVGDHKLDMRGDTLTYDGNDIPVGAKMVAHGVAGSGTGAAGATRSVQVSFGVTFPSAPRVLVTCHSAVPERVSVGVSNWTTTGFTLNLNRTDTGNTNVTWFAYI